MTFSRAVERVIAVARRGAAAADADLRRRAPAVSDREAGDVPEGVGEGGSAELERVLAGLPAERVFALAYLMGVGRGEVGAAEAGSARGADESGRSARRGAAAKRLASRPGLAEDLVDGVAELARAGCGRRAAGTGRAAGGPAGWPCPARGCGGTDRRRWAVPSSAFTVHLAALLRDAEELDDVHQQMRASGTARPRRWRR